MDNPSEIIIKETAFGLSGSSFFIFVSLFKNVEKTMNGLKDILERLKIEQLNPMQEASVEAFDKGGEDLILLSPTGSGKTLAFLLPLVGSLRLM